jgi:glutamyl-tRNA reductase
MRLHLWGTDFRRGTAEMRGKLYFAPEEREKRIKELLSVGFADLVYLNTCNRVEFYTTAPDYFADTRKLWIRLLATFGMSEEEYYRGYHFEGKSAVRHLLRVACSLESLVIGEPQILGQLKEALSWTQAQGLPVDVSLLRSFNLAFETAKKVRAETSIGEKPVSVANLGLEHLQRMESDFALSRAVIVGRSPINLIVLQWLKKNRPNCELVWVNRTVESLAAYPESKFVSLKRLDEFLASPHSFSHMFTATASSEPLFDSRFFAKVPGRQLVFDFAQPPDVMVPECDCEAVVIHLEDLKDEAQQNAISRKVAVDESDCIIETALREYCLQQKQAPLMRGFSEVEPHFINELQRALGALGQDKEFPPELHPKIKRWAEKLVRKNLHSSREQLRMVLENVSLPASPMIEVL